MTPSAPASRHFCHWPGCDVPVSPSLWGCRVHWHALPRDQRALILAAYEPGQEVSKRPSRAYIEAAMSVQRWIAENEAAKGAGRPVQESLL